MPASPERVFRALTDADELSRWWTTTAESDPRTGGTFSYGFEFEDAVRNHVHRGWGEGADWDEAVSLHEQGWGFFLDNLVAYLDRGEDLRQSAPMGQKTAATI